MACLAKCYPAYCTTGALGSGSLLLSAGTCLKNSTHPCGHPNASTTKWGIITSTMRRRGSRCSSENAACHQCSGDAILSCSRFSEASTPVASRVPTQRWAEGGGGRSRGRRVIEFLVAAVAGEGESPRPDPKDDEEEGARSAEEQTAETAIAKPVLKRGDIVRVDKELYLKSVEFKAVDHPPNFSGLDYIYEDRGEILEIREFEAGQYCLLAWAGIPTAPAWLPTYMLIKSEKLSYVRD